MKFLTIRHLALAFSGLILFLTGCGGSGDDSSSSSDSSNTICLKLASDSSDSVYITGYTASSFNDEANIGESDIFLVKHDSDGTFAWSKLIGTTDDDYVQDIAVIPSGETLIAGYTYSALDNNSNEGGSDFIIIKTAADGTTTWEKQFGTSQDDFAYGITFDATGDIFVTGHTYGSLRGTISGTKDFVLIKLNSSGTQQWARQISNDEDDSFNSTYGVYGIDVALDNAGSIYAAGFTTGKLQGNTSSGKYDIFVTKFNSSGTRLWLKQFGSTDNEYTRGIQVTGAGDVYITGYTDGALSGQTNEGETDIFLVKLDTGGTIQWIRQTGSEEADVSYGIELDSLENIFITGYTAGDYEGDNIGGTDMLLIKYNATGTLQWTKQLGTDSSEVSRALSIDTGDKIYLTGYTYGELDDESNSDNDYYSFISRYSNAGSQSWTVLF